MQSNTPSNIPDILKPFDQYQYIPESEIESIADEDSDVDDCRDETRKKVDYAMVAIGAGNASFDEVIGSIKDENIASGSLNIALDTVEEDTYSSTEKITLDVARRPNTLEIKKWNIPGVEPRNAMILFVIVAGGNVFAEQKSKNKHQRISLPLPQGPFALVVHMLVSSKLPKKKKKIMKLPRHLR